MPDEPTRDANDAPADWHPWREPRDDGRGGFETPYVHQRVRVRLPGETSPRVINPLDLPPSIDARHVMWRPVGAHEADTAEDHASSQTSDSGRRGEMAGSIRILAHVSFRGDITFKGGELGGSDHKSALVEGFAIDLGGGRRSTDIAYQGVAAGGVATPVCAGGEFCGTRGEGKPLFGFAVRTLGDLGRHYECEYRATFADGTSVGPLRQGEPCETPTRSPLKLFEVNLVPRHTWPKP